MRLIHVAVSHPSNGGNATHTFQVDIQQLNGVLDNRNQMTFIYNNNGADMLSSTLHFNEVMINGQFTFSGLNMGVLTGLVLTFEFEKC
ncbi:MAG: hypothetical protein MUP09_00275 [Thiovulaceae bacterium]|nr:hypothetical protein [Sulfurimonadaceae bacterium]